MNKSKYSVRIRTKNFGISLIYTILFFAYSEIESIYHYYPSIWRLLSYIQVMSFFLIPVLSMIYIKKELKKVDSFKIMIGMYCNWLLLTTFVHNGAMADCAYGFLKLICYLMLSALIIKRNPQLFVFLTLGILWSYSIVNLLTILQYPYPGGMYISQMSDGSLNIWNWFLGYKNSFIRYYLPATFLGCIYQNLLKSKLFYILNYGMLAIMTISLILVNAATSYVGIIAIAVFSVVVGVYPKFRKATPVLYFGTNVFVFFALIIGNMITSWVSYFVVVVLNKTITFSSRRNIWNLSLEAIKNNPILGMGYMKGQDVASVIGMQHSHNMYLWHAFRGGIPYLVLFAIILYFALKSASNYKNEVVAHIAMFSLFILMIMWQFEVFGDSILIFSIVYLVWHIDSLCVGVSEQQVIKRKHFVINGRKRMESRR